MSWNIKTPGDYINGPLTVAGNAIFNSNVGIGAAIPASKLHISNTAAATRITITDDTANGRSGYIESNYSDALVIGTTSGVRAIRFSPDGKPYYQIATDGVQTWLDGVGGIRMTLNSNGLGIGTGSPSGASGRVLEIYGGAGQARYVLKNDATGSASTDGSQIALVGSQLVIQNREASEITFETNGSERGRFNSTGAFVLGGGATAANGIGIAFPAAQSASTDANTLDDYEEGVWTATLRGGTSEPANLAQNTARYTKIGRQVTVHVAFENIDTTGYAGPIRISGLPFANSAIRTMGSAGTFLGSTFSETQIVALTASDTALEFMDIKSNAVWTASTHFTGSGRYFWATLTYTVA